MPTTDQPGPLEALSLALDELDAMNDTLTPHERFGLERAQRRAFGLDPTIGAREADRKLAHHASLVEALSECARQLRQLGVNEHGPTISYARAVLAAVTESRDAEE